MIVGGVHESMSKAPSIPMFGAKRPRGQSGQGDLTDALTGMAKTIASALKPDSELATSTVAVGYSSPNKAADLRSKYIRQLKELHELCDIGALNDSEYEEQRRSVVNLMRQLK